LFGNIGALVLIAITKMTPLTVREIVSTAAALVLAILAWRIVYALIDRFYGRRFVSRFIPRVNTFSQLSKSITSFVIFVALVLVLLNIWEVNVAPAVWSAGIVTAALAFGAQAIVRDVLTGFSALLEDQYDVGDVVELVTTVNSTIAGTVEAVGLRSTRIIDDRGRHIFVPNGAILYAINSSRMPNRQLFTLMLPLRAAIGEMRAKLEEIVLSAAEQAGVRDGTPRVRVQDVGQDGATFAVEFRTPRSEAGATLAAIRERVAAELQNLGWLPGKPAT
jgi:moderate conductance mechanosensitive channel